MSAPNPDIIAVLKRALKDARSGRTQAIAFSQIGRIDARDGEGEWLTTFFWPDGEIDTGEKLQRAIARSFDEVSSALSLERLTALYADRAS